MTRSVITPREYGSLAALAGFTMQEAMREAARLNTSSRKQYLIGFTRTYYATITLDTLDETEDLMRGLYRARQ